MADFGGALAALRQSVGPFSLVLPTLPHIEREVRGLGGALARAADDRARRSGEIRRVSRRSRGLAASGTVTLELALAGVPMVGAYKVSLVEEQLKYLIKVPSILLPNLILGERAIPEKLQRDCAPAALGAALAEIVRDGPARARPARSAVAARSAHGAARRRRAQRPRRARRSRDDRGGRRATVGLTVSRRAHG